MKRFLVCVIAMLCFCACSEKAEDSANNDVNDKDDWNTAVSVEGRFISTKDGNCMILDESDCPVVMSNETGDSDVFKDLDTGDVIRVECDYIMESYPAQTAITKLEFVSDGELSDLPSEVIKTLEDMGWEISE